MGEGGTKFQWGSGDVQYHPVPFLLLKQPPRNNVLIGDDAVQIRFVEQLTGLVCETRDSVTDDDLFGRDGVLYRLLTDSGLSFTPQVRNKTGVWSLAPITPGSAGANALVRAAAGILGEKLAKDRLESLSRHVGKLFERKEIADLRVGLWETVWAMTADLLPHRWREPWESTLLQDWVPRGVDLGLRFGALFKNLRAYVLIQTGAEQEARKMGVSPHKLLQFKDLRLNSEKVYESLKALSRWKHFDSDPRIVALALAKVWAS